MAHLVARDEVEWCCSCGSSGPCTNPPQAKCHGARIAALESLLAAQVDFTERLRHAANAAIANASHINQNYCRDVPKEKLSEWAEAQVTFNILSVTPSPAQAVSAVVRGGDAVN